MKTETRQLISVGAGGVAFGAIAAGFAATFYVFNGHPLAFAITSTAQGLLIALSMLIRPFINSLSMMI